MNNYDGFLNHIKSLKKFSIKPGLIRIKKILNKLGNPQNKIKIIHIAGTNGKGSTAIFISKLLQNMNYKTGLFTSPELLDYKDRISINNKTISENEIIKLSNKIKSVIKKSNIYLTEFEFCTVIMYLYFYEHKIDYAVIETGLGGRLDSTNLGNKTVSVITSIDKDHSEYLGNKLQNIVFEKCSILKNSKYAVINKLNPYKKKLVKNFIKNNFKIPVYYFNENFKLITKNDKLYFKSNDIKIDITEIKNFPEYQKYNLCSALQVCTLIEKNKILKIDVNTIIKNTVLPFRLQKIKNKPVIYIDNSHNIEAVKTFIKSVKTMNLNFKKIIVIYSGFKDKPYNKIIDLLSNNFKKILIFNLENERAQDFSKLKLPRNIFFFENIKDIFNFIYNNKRFYYFVTGSHITAKIFYKNFITYEPEKYVSVYP